MARVTVEDCIRHYPNRFEMVQLAARRGKQLLRGMPVALEGETHKPTVQALREIGEGYMTWEYLFDLEERERLRLLALQDEEEEAE